MKILATLLVVGYLVMVGNFQVNAEKLMVVVKKKHKHADFGRKFGSSFDEEGRKLVDEEENDDASSGTTESHRLFPDEGTPKTDNLPRRTP